MTNNSSMEKIYFSLLLFFILLIVLPLGFKIKLSYSFLNNLGTFSFSFFKIKLKVILFYIKDTNIIIRTKKYKKQLDIVVSKEQIVYVKQLINQLKEKIKIKRITFHSKIGLQDAMKSAICSALTNDIVSILTSIIKSKKPYAKIRIESSTLYNDKAFDCNLNMKVSLSIFDLLYCLFMALVKSRRRAKYERV